MTFNPRASLALLSLIAAPFLAQPASSIAATVPQVSYSNLGAGGAFGTGYYFVSGPVYGAYTYAAPFVAGVSGHLDHIDLPLQPASSNAGAVVSIFQDKAGVPGTNEDGPSLEEWLDEKLPSPVVAIKFNSRHKPLLIAGQKYWVVVAPLFYDSVVYWKQNSTSQTGIDATTSGETNNWSAYTANSSVAPALDVWVK